VASGGEPLFSADLQAHRGRDRQRGAGLSEPLRAIARRREHSMPGGFESLNAAAAAAVCLFSACGVSRFAGVSC
jgi:hypothetical protein